jgi:hypothetical protein
MSLMAWSRHLGDDDLVRYMDHQLDHGAMRVTGVHLRTCPACAERLEALKQRSALASDWLALLPEVMPDDNKRAVALAAIDRARFRRRPDRITQAAWMKAAAAVALLLGVGLATEPGRAVVARGVVSLSGAHAGPVATTLVQWLGQEKALHPSRTLAAAPAPPPAAAPARSLPGGDMRMAPASAPAPRPDKPHRAKAGTSEMVSFTPSGPDVTLVFNSLQREGSATLWLRDVRHASGQAVMGYRGESLVPTADGLEVRNRPESRADYMITVPTRYRFIRVRVGDGPEMIIRNTKSKQEWIWTINLRTSALD